MFDHGDFLISCKSSIVIPLIKKPGLDREMLKNHRPVSNLSFLSKVIEKVISIRILGHILDNTVASPELTRSVSDVFIHTQYEIAVI